MKIRIIGPCGSGKTFTAKALSEQFEIPFYETDNIIWDRKENKKYTLEIRNEKLRNILFMENWIIEGAQYKWSFESFEKADLIVVLNPYPVIRNLRVIKRFIEMQLGLKQYNYRQSWTELIEMFKQNREYDRSTFKSIVSVTEKHNEKRIIAKNSQEIFEHIKSM